MSPSGVAGPISWLANLYDRLSRRSTSKCFRKLTAEAPFRAPAKFIGTNGKRILLNDGQRGTSASRTSPLIRPAKGWWPGAELNRRPAITLHPAFESDRNQELHYFQPAASTPARRRSDTSCSRCLAAYARDGRGVLPARLETGRQRCDRRAPSLPSPAPHARPGRTRTNRRGWPRQQRSEARPIVAGRCRGDAESAHITLGHRPDDTTRCRPVCR